MAFYKSKFTGEEIDQRLAQGTFDDAVKAGFTGTKEQFDQLLAKIQETTNAAEASQPAESDKLETVNKNIVDAINEIQVEVNTKQPAGDYATKTELTENVTVIKNDMVGRKTPEGGEIFNLYEGPLANLAPSLDAHAEGRGTHAKGEHSHAEGRETRAIGMGAHVEGKGSSVEGQYSHAEGVNNTVTGNFSHAEGNNNRVEGQNAHAEGYGNIVYGNWEHAEGRYNVSHHEGTVYKDQTVHSVGIGITANSRQNAHEIMKNGDHYILGIGGYDGDNYQDADTLQDVVNKQSSDIETLKSAGYQTAEQVESTVNSKIDELTGAAPEALDTLKEIGDALNNDPNFAATMTTELSKKVDKVEGKQLSTEDYTTAEKEKLASLKNYDDTSLRSELQQTETGVATANSEIQKLKSGKQSIQDETLQTTDKTVVGAINELLAKVQELKQDSGSNLNIIGELQTNDPGYMISNELLSIIKENLDKIDSNKQNCVRIVFNQETYSDSSVVGPVTIYSFFSFDLLYRTDMIKGSCILENSVLHIGTAEPSETTVKLVKIGTDGNDPTIKIPMASDNNEIFYKVLKSYGYDFISKITEGTLTGYYLNDDTWVSKSFTFNTFWIEATTPSLIYDGKIILENEEINLSELYVPSNLEEEFNQQIAEFGELPEFPTE